MVLQRHQKMETIPSYSRRSSHSDDDYFDAQRLSTHKRYPPLFNWTCYLIFWGCGLIMGFATGLISSHATSNAIPVMRETNLPGALPRVSLQGWVEQHVERDQNFEVPPAENVEQEPLWDSLLPRGLGYIIHPDIAPNLSVIGVFHALHCLYTIRRAYYAPNEAKHSFDLGLERGPHVGHCFDYLRQSLTCTVDPTIEPATKRVFEDPTWGFNKQCRDYEEVKAWAEQYRVWDVAGTFTPFDEMIR